ncbi:protein GRIP-like isoform X1 [Salvia miltiorrhiza]|uniref:protein GRIP-like isoform X1 n=1 Tax=Salvia miltiorrhiza TaxID=226208 RepID=UPI0025ABDD05|nr:protein GRIP-like isoform X1 [Salvia miltiorrhiza]
MSQEEGESGGMPENHVADVAEHETKQLNPDSSIDSNLVKENGLHVGNTHSNYYHDELVQMVQNEYMKSQDEGLKILLESDQPDTPKVQEHDSQAGNDDSDKPDPQKIEEVDSRAGNDDSDQPDPERGSRAGDNDSDRPDPQNVEDRHSGVGDDLRDLSGEIESLKRELLEERQTRYAAEEALKHLRAAHLEADTKAQELAAKFDEAQKKMDQEIKERDEKYSELDTKFNRLHKRAKQRIQEVQKEKDDLEVQFREVNEKADMASSQLSAMKQELERTRQHANEAMKAMDGERQQLRSANNKLRDSLEELRHSLIPKESALEAMQQSLIEKEQMLEDLRGLLQLADEKRQASLTELSLKHQKQVENLESQIAEVLAERSRATETISSLRALIVEKDTKIAEMDAASSGEAARLRAAMETLKGELNHLKNEHEKEKEVLETALQSMKSKLEISESNRIHAEVEAAKLRSQLESELSVQSQLLNNKDSELVEANDKIKRIESEFASYKVRAHALLQKKDAELASTRDNDQFKALEEALKDAEKEILLVTSEKDKALQDLKDVQTNLDKEIFTRDAALSIAEQQIKSLQLKFDSTLSNHQSEKEAWDKSLQNVEETWRLRCEALERQNEECSSQNLEKEVDELKLQCKKLKDEQRSFHDLADKMMEEKDKEISRLLDDNENLRQLLDSRPSVEYSEDHTALHKQEASNSSTSAADQQILILARQQAQREDELAQTQRHILALQEELEELEHENRLHRQQEAMLKEELRNMERMQKREGVDLTYLKNVILKLLETGEVERLLPVVGMLLQFSPDEMQKCQQAYRASNEVPPSPANDSSRSGPSLFSRFSFA